MAIKEDPEPDAQPPTVDPDAHSTAVTARPYGRFDPITLPPGCEPISITVIRDRGYDASDNATIAEWEASQKASE